MNKLRISFLAVGVFAAAAFAQSGKAYADPPRDINMEGKYRTMSRLCYGGKMVEAEAKAAQVLNLGYINTRYECWVYDKLARSYEKVGNSSKAIEYYQKVIQSSDPKKGSYTRAMERLKAIGGAMPSMSAPIASASAARPAAPVPAQAPAPPAAVQPKKPVSTTPVSSVPAPRPVKRQVNQHQGPRTYADPPRDINMEAKYRTLGRLCYGGKMVEAEAKAAQVLNLGYINTRYECWVYDKLARSYEKFGNLPKAVEYYEKCMESSDPKKGSYIRAKGRLQAIGASADG